MNGLSDLIVRLAANGVQFVLVGGYAAVVHGVSFVTRDIDICLSFSPENLLRLHTALRDLHPRHRLTPQRLPFQPTAESSTDLKNLYLETDWGVIDCLGEVLGIGGFEAVLARSSEIEFPFGKCRVLEIDALIEAKEKMGRPHDLLTVRQLKAIKEAKKGRSG